MPFAVPAPLGFPCALGCPGCRIASPGPASSSQGPPSAAGSGNAGPEVFPAGKAIKPHQTLSAARPGRSGGSGAARGGAPLGEGRAGLGFGAGRGPQGVFLGAEEPEEGLNPGAGRGQPRVTDPGDGTEREG